MKRAARIALLAGLLCALVAALAPTQQARGDAYTYSTKRRVFKVGVLLIDSAAYDYSGYPTTPPIPLTRGTQPLGPENPDPFVFFIADARTDLKPLSWEFINPLAPKTVTPDIKSRWDARDPSNPYAISQTVTKNMAAYWEVSLSKASLDELLQFDLLFITNHRDVKFTPAEREKMRKLVDAGGVIWIEECGGMRMRADGKFFLEDLQFRTTGGRSTPYVYAPNHPILNTPYKLNFDEIAELGDKGYGSYVSGFTPAEDANPTGPINRGTQSNRPPSPQNLINIVGTRAAQDGAGRYMPYIAAGNYGSGAVIATASDSGCDINDYCGGLNIGSGGNSGAYCGTNLQAARSADLKFLYNLVAWGNANNAERRNARRTAASFDSVGAPLLTRFDFNTPGTPANSVVQSTSSPLIVKGVSFSTGFQQGGTTPVLRAYDTQPYRDSDFDGNPDDGIPDLALGAPYDEIWRVNLPGGTGAIQPSAPTFATITPASGNPVEVILVTLADSSVVAYPAFPLDANNRLPATSTLVWTNAPTGSSGTYATRTGTAPSPIYYDGKVFVVQPDGNTRCIDGISGVTAWTAFDPTTLAGPLRPLGPPTVGFVRLNSTAGGIGSYSGGNTLDLMLYQPVAESSGSGVVGRILPYWLGTRNEVLLNPTDTSGTAPSPAGPGWLYLTRAGLSGGRYFVARPGGADGPFVSPRVRVYAAETIGGTAATARENFEAGRESFRYGGQFVAGTQAPYFDGRVVVYEYNTPGDPNSGGKAPTGIAPGNLLVAVDYDIVYINAGGVKPAGLAGDGSRDFPDRVLRTNGDSADVPASLDTIALSPEDLLVYAARETGPSATVTSIYMTNEQPGRGNTKVRSRFSLHPGLGAPSGLGTGGVPVGNATIQELPAITNRLAFDPGWPRTANDLALNAADAAYAANPWNYAITNVTPVGAPVVTNDGITYVLATGTSAVARGGAPGPVSVLMALKTNPSIVLNIGPLDATRVNDLVIQQVDPLSDPANPTIVRLQPNQYTVDAARGKVTITNFQSGLSGNAISASLSFVVTATLAGSGNTPVTQVHTPLNSAFQDDFSPLLWYYVLPGRALSSPTLIGDYIYFTSDSGFTQAGGPTSLVVALDADPQQNDPSIKAGQQIVGVVPTLNGVATTNNHTKWKESLEPAAGVATPVVALSPTVGAQGSLVINSSAGTYAFEDVITLVADGKRVLEVNTDGAAVWAIDSTVRYTDAGGELPVYDPGSPNGIANPPAVGRRVEERTPISRPTTVKRLSQADLLIADTGNNRVVRVDRSGRILWDLETITDPLGILPGGEPLTLSNPTDVQFWLATTYDQPFNNTARKAVGYEAHYLIADAGNFRVIEVVDYYDSDGQLAAPGQHVLVWTSRTRSTEGRRLRFQSVQRFIGPDGLPLVVAVVGNLRASGGGATAENDFSGGALAQLGYKPVLVYRPAAGNVQKVWADDTIPPNPVTAEPASSGLIPRAIDDVRVLNPDGSFSNVARMTRPLYFEQITLPNPGNTTNPTKLIYLICDANGVYEVTIDPTTLQRNVTWSFTQDDYNAMNVGRLGIVAPTPALINSLPKFLPSSVRRLPNGNFLITNSFTGGSLIMDNRQFNGEVFEVKPNRNPTTLIGQKVTGTTGAYAGFSSPRLLPGITGTGKFRQLMGGTGNTGLLEQPLFGDRLF